MKVINLAEIKPKYSPRINFSDKVGENCCEQSFDCIDIFGFSWQRWRQEDPLSNSIIRDSHNLTKVDTTIDVAFFAVSIKVSPAKRLVKFKLCPIVPHWEG